MLASKPLFKRTWWLHLLLWALSFYSIGSYFSISNYLKFIDFIYSGIFHIPLLLLVYINLQVLIPRFLQKEKYGLFLLAAIANILLAYALHELVFDIILAQLTLDFYMVSFTEPSVLFAIFGIYMLLSTLLQLSFSWYRLHEIEKEKLSLELKTLKMQINPHFLFNSLNSIYALSLKKSDDAPKSILELSSLMRYMIYEVSDEVVPLKQEIEALEHFIRLQKLRLAENVDIKFEKQVSNPELPVAPMLFLPLIENSFKHGMKSKTGNYVHINLSAKDREIRFRISNNKSKKDDPETGQFGGIGLQNVAKRLHLIYGDEAQIEEQDLEQDFKVELRIKVNA